MTILWLLALALFAFSAITLATRLHDAVTTWWNRAINDYARWVSLEFEAMFEEVPIERARRILTLSRLGGAVIGFLSGASLFGRFLFAAIGGVAGYMAPRMITKRMQKRRLKQIDNQLVDALVLMANSLKSGLSFQQALEMVVREMRPPISDEFGRIVKEIQLGRLTDDALIRFMENVPLEDVRLAVDAMLTLRETGGNLSETFQVIARTIGERKKVEGRISAMTAQGMTQGTVMCLMPIAMMALFSFLDPNYMRLFFTTPIGIIMLVLVLFLDLMGLWMMRKLVRVDV
jgi:tight adherence protein B